MNLVTYIKSLFDTTPLDPTKRYETKSQACPRDLKIKKVAVNTCYGAGIGGAITSAIVPMMAINIVSMGLGTAVGAAAAGVFGGAASLWTMKQSEKLEKYFDWTDYSDRSQVMKDTMALKNVKLKVLLKVPSSPAYRINNLKRYGVLSKDFAERMQNIVTRFQKVDRTITSINYEFPLVTQRPSDNEAEQRIATAFEKAKEEKRKIKEEWNRFQKEVSADLPNFSPAA
jgi:hypothetical protein